MKDRCARQFFAQIQGAHYVIEGQMFPSVKSVYLACVDRGFVGCATVISARLKAGCDTWAALSAPKTDKMDRCNAGRAKRLRESKEEMARICAELDARKAALSRP